MVDEGFFSSCLCFEYVIVYNKMFFRKEYSITGLFRIAKQSAGVDGDNKNQTDFKFILLLSDNSFTVSTLLIVST